MAFSASTSLTSHRISLQKKLSATARLTPNPAPFRLSFPVRSRSETELGFSDAPHRLQVLAACQLKADVVTSDCWDNLIKNSEVPVLVEFYAPWCGPCRMVHRIVGEIAEEYAGKIKCFVLDTDKDLDIADEYEIKAVPVVVLFKNGKKYESVVGTMPKDFYVAAIKRVMES